MFVKNDGTNEDIHAADKVLVAHRYNCSDNPLNVARKKLYKNSATTRLPPSHSSPTEDASNHGLLNTRSYMSLFRGQNLEAELNL